MGTDSELFWKSTEDSCIFVEKLFHYLIKKLFKIMLTIELKFNEKTEKNKNVFSTFLPVKCCQNSVDCSNCYSVFSYIHCYSSSSILQRFVIFLRFSKIVFGV